MFRALSRKLVIFNFRGRIHSVSRMLYRLLDIRSGVGCIFGNRFTRPRLKYADNSTLFVLFSIIFLPWSWVSNICAMNKTLQWANGVKESLLQQGKSTNLIDEVIATATNDDFLNLDGLNLSSIEASWVNLEDRFSSFAYVPIDALISLGIVTEYSEHILFTIAGYLANLQKYPSTIDHWLDITRSNNGDVILNKVSIGAYGIIELPDEITHIADGAFPNANRITIKKLPKRLKSIGASAFCGCSFTNVFVSLPETLTKIGWGAFFGTNLVGVYIPASVNKIDGAFMPESRRAIVVDENNTRYDSRYDCNAIIETQTRTLIQGCNNTIIPEEIIRIGDWAFSDCWRLKVENLPEHLVEIGAGAFRGCGSLHLKELPEGLAVIESGTFEHSSIQQLDIPSTVRKIEDEAFYESQLQELYIPCGSDIEVGNIGVRGTDVQIFADEGLEWLIQNVYTGAGGYCDISDNATYIPTGAFEHSLHREEITEIEIPESVTTIEAEAFRGCTNLKVIEIPSSVTDIDKDAFAGCNAVIKRV